MYDRGRIGDGMGNKKKSRLTAAALIIFCAILGNYLRFSEPVGAASLGIETVRLTVPGANTALPYVEEEIDAEFLDLLRAKEVVFRTYAPNENTPVWLFMGYFDQQKEGSQVHSPIHCYPGSGWSIVSEKKVPAPWGAGSIRALVVSDGFDERLVHYWYQTPGSVLSGVFGLKLRLTTNAIVRKPQEVVFVRISTSLQGDRSGAEERLRKYSVDVKEKIESLYRNRHETG